MKTFNTYVPTADRNKLVLKDACCVLGYRPGAGWFLDTATLTFTVAFRRKEELIAEGSCDKVVILRQNYNTVSRRQEVSEILPVLDAKDLTTNLY